MRRTLISVLAPVSHFVATMRSAMERTLKMGQPSFQGGNYVP